MQKQQRGTFGGVRDVRPYESTDIRFTTKGETLYAFCMGNPTDDVKITSLGTDSKISNKKVASVKMLGSKEKLQWTQGNDALTIRKPSELPDWKVIGFKIEFE